MPRRVSLFALQPGQALVAAALVCALTPVVVAAQSAPVSTRTASESTAEAVDAFVEKTLAAQSLAGASVAVISNGKIVLAKGYGFSDLEKKTRATEQTIYQLGSITKPFTAMATLMLMEEGRLTLEARVNDLLPGMPEAWSGVTVRHLLSHTSGIKSYTELFGAQKIGPERTLTSDDILALVRDVPLAFAPGERYAYCNTGYYLLGMIIEKVSGKAYGRFLGERIFAPLEMRSTSLDDYADVRPTRAKGYGATEGPTTLAPHTHPSQPFAAGAVVSTVVDLAKWNAALDARKLLTPASYALMWTPMRLNDGKPSTYALGWQVESYRTRPRVAHGGNITGFGSYFQRYPDDRVTVIALVNQSGAGVQPLANGVAEIYIPALKDNAPKPITDGDPATTAFLREVLTAAAGGSAKAEWLTPEFAAFLLPDRVKDGPQMMGRHGPLQAFELMEDATRDGRRVRIYRATFGTTPLRVQFVLSPEGKVAGLGISPGG
jgi:CubicO group peptidase (beta-lactamase class C family)